MGKISELIDSFNDNSRDTTKWPTIKVFGTGVTVTETGGQLVIQPASATGSNYSGYQSGTYDLTGSFALVQVVQATTSASSDTSMNVDIDDPNSLNFTMENGTLYAFQKVANVRTTIQSTSYSATTHKWWKIREASGTTYWDTSIDGITWTNFANTPNPLTVTSMYVWLNAGTFASVTPNATIFENFNTVPHSNVFGNYVSAGNGMSTSGVAN